MRVNSSNGKTIYISEHYEFDSSAQVWAACAQTASAYTPAVQSLLGKLITSPEFKFLVTPENQESHPSSTATPLQPNLAASEAPINNAPKTRELMSETVSQRLRELQSLRKDGVISEEEFQTKKRQLLEKL